MEYTEEQKRIIETPGNLLIIAGPGTGKTYTLIGKVHSLLDFVSPEKILVLTYSVKTSQELKVRFQKSGLSDIKIDTFHGLAYDLWKEHFQKTPNLISEKEKSSIIKKLFKKNKNSFKDPKNKEIYFQYLKKNNLLDFELLLYEVSQFNFLDFKDHYIIIDEFQDLSSDILNFLKIFKKAVFILFGDPNQSIYSFKNVNLKELYNFWKNFRPDLKILSLSLSFRCPENILKYAETFKNAPWEVPSYKALKKEGIVQGFFFKNIYEEVDFLIKLIKNLLGGLQLEEQKYDTVSPNDIFILSRIKNVFLPLKNSFQKSGIPVNLAEEEANLIFERIQEIVNILKTSSIPVEDHLKNLNSEIKVFLENLWALSFNDKEKFLAYLTSLTPSDFLNTNKEGINFLSIHASKGLEAEYVILVGAEADLIPLKIFKDTLEEEEKRLVYVALTRAKKGFYFTATNQRKIFYFNLNKGLSPYFKNFPLKIFKPKPIKPKQTGLF